MHRVSLLVFSLVLAGCSAGSSGIEVIVRNDGTAVVNDLTLAFSGGEKSVSSLPAGQKASFRINPKGESHLGLAFTDSGGQRKSTNIDVYFETGYQGVVDVRIDQSGRVSWVDNIILH